METSLARARHAISAVVVISRGVAGRCCSRYHVSGVLDFFFANQRENSTCWEGRTHSRLVNEDGEIVIACVYDFS